MAVGLADRRQVWPTADKSRRPWAEVSPSQSGTSGVSRFRLFPATASGLARAPHPISHWCACGATREHINSVFDCQHGHRGARFEGGAADVWEQDDVGQRQ